jgi:MYXO-CTERM domain-containing protein
MLGPALLLLAPLAALPSGPPTNGPGVVGHGGGIAPTAWPNEPYSVADVADKTYRITWSDTDAPIITGTATVDLFYTAVRPVPFQLGVVPADLVGEPIALGVLEADPTNTVEWDTEAVPAGTYFVWTRVNEPPAEMSPIQVIAFARGVVTVAHAGDPVPPAVIVSAPDDPFAIAEGPYLIRYEARDPDGSARVRIEVTTSSLGEDLRTIGQDLPAVADGQLRWDTQLEPEGSYLIRATIEDGRGLSFSAWGRWILRVEHPLPPPDAGPRVDAAIADGGGALPPLEAYDGGLRDAGTVDDLGARCACRAADRPRAGPAAGLVLLGLLAVLRRRRC